jgi:hypothetical protein
MRFDMICEANGIEQRLTKLSHPWSSEDQKTIRGIVLLRDGQVERMNRTIKDATFKRFHYDSMIRCERTSQTSSCVGDDSPPDCRLFPPHKKVSRVGSRPSTDSLLTNTSVRSGLQSRTDSS